MHILTKNNNESNFTYTSDGKTLTIGKDGYMPYDLTFGAMSGCLMITLQAIATKSNKTINAFNVIIDGRHSDVSPYLLEKVSINATIEGDGTQEELKAMFDLALQKCSMVQTFMKIATFDVNLQAISKLNQKVCSINGEGC